MNNTGKQQISRSLIHYWNELVTPKLVKRPRLLKARFRQQSHAENPDGNKLGINQTWFFKKLFIIEKSLEPN